MAESDGDIECYIARVVATISQWQSLAEDLQIKKTEEAWQNFFPKLQLWAYKLFCKWGAFLDNERLNEANKASIDGATAIFTSYFPFDVSFEAWAYNLQRNVCRHRVRDSIKRANEPVGQALELDAWDGWEIRLPDPAIESLDSVIWEKEAYNKVQKSLELLTIDQQAFIELYYFNGFTYGEVANLMDKSKNAIYSLNHNAIKQLRILVEN